MNCLHPGVVASRFAQPRNGQGGDPSAASFLASQGIAPEKSAEAIVYLASSPDLAQTTGQYFNQSRLSTPSAEAQDDTTAKKLWEESERLGRNQLRNRAGTENWLKKWAGHDDPPEMSDYFLSVVVSAFFFFFFFSFLVVVSWAKLTVAAPVRKVRANAKIPNLFMLKTPLI